MGKSSREACAGSARPVFHDIRGAPFKIGSPVRVRQLADRHAEPAALGAQGVIEYLEYSCGCGQSYPHDPMIGVRLQDGSLHEFWREELRLVLK